MQTTCSIRKCCKLRIARRAHAAPTVPPIAVHNFSRYLLLEFQVLRQTPFSNRFLPFARARPVEGFTGVHRSPWWLTSCRTAAQILNVNKAGIPKVHGLDVVNMRWFEEQEIKFPLGRNFICVTEENPKKTRKTSYDAKQYGSDRRLHQSQAPNQSLQTMKNRCIFRSTAALHLYRRSTSSVPTQEFMIERGGCHRFIKLPLTARGCNAVACRGLTMLGAKTWLYAPHQILVLVNVRNTGAANLPSQTFATRKKIAPQKLHFKCKLRREKSCTSLAPCYATITTDLNL